MSEGSGVSEISPRFLAQICLKSNRKMLLVTESEQRGLDGDADHHLHLSDGTPFTGARVRFSETRKCVAMFIDPKIVCASDGAKESGVWELGDSTRAFYSGQAPKGRSRAVISGL
jgi:hypothetical protein